MLHGFPGRNFNDGVARALNAHGYGTLQFRYRGAHGSEGRYAFAHNEEDAALALEAALAGALPAAPHEGVALLGYSMGGLHAVRTLAARPDLASRVRFLALQAPVAHVAKLRERAEMVAPGAFHAFLASGEGLLNAEHADLVAEADAMREDEEPFALAPRLRVPTVIVHGTRDEQVPVEQGRDLHAALAEPKRLVELDADHAFEGAHAPRVASEVHRFAQSVALTRKAA